VPNEELSKLIGKNTSIAVYKVESGAIRRFTEAVGDFNSAFRDEELARQTPAGVIIAPPGFFGWPIKNTENRALLVEFPQEMIAELEKNGYSMATAIDAAIEYDYNLPVCAGDTLNVTSTLKDIRERVSKAGKLVIFVMETVYSRQNSELVATTRATYLLRGNIS
jgi:acyl dehydratase